jgi:hypothetical protein
MPIFTIREIDSLFSSPNAWSCIRDRDKEKFPFDPDFHSAANRLFFLYTRTQKTIPEKRTKNADDSTQRSICCFLNYVNFNMWIASKASSAVGSRPLNEPRSRHYSQIAPPSPKK